MNPLIRRAPSRGSNYLWLLVAAVVVSLVLGGLGAGFGMADYFSPSRRGHQGIPGSPGPAPSSPATPSHVPIPSNGAPGVPGSNAPLPSNGPVGPPGSNAPIPSASPSPSPLPPGCNSFAETVCAEDIVTGGITTESVCTEAYQHTASGTILPNWSVQKLSGSTPPVPPLTGGFPVTAFPLNSVALGGLANGNTITTAQGLVITATSATISFVQIGGETMIQLGEPEPVFSGSKDLVPPFNRQSVSLTIGFDSTLLPAGAQIAAIDYVAEYSSEAGFDFFTASGAAQFSVSGPGTPSNPYLNISGSISLFPGVLLTLRFTKDDLVYEGVDNCHFRIRNFRASLVPSPATFGTPGLNMVLPSNLSAYDCHEITVCAADSNVHVINLTSTGLAFNKAGDYTEMLFVGGNPCCVKMSTSSTSSHVTVLTPQVSCAQFCRANGQGCTTSLDVISHSKTALSLPDTGTFPSTHELIILNGTGPTFHFIPCDLLSLYVGRRYLVTNGRANNRQISILVGNKTCGAHFQVGDPLSGRQAARRLELDADVAASVEFVVVSESLIVVTANSHIRHCDAITGQCARVGEMLNIMSGWWAEYGTGFTMASPYPAPTGTLVYISDRATTAAGQLQVDHFQGPPKYTHLPNVGASSYNLNEYPSRYTTYLTMLTPFEFSFGPAARYTKVGQINPANTNEMFLQSFSFGPGNNPAIIASRWDPRASYFAPYLVYKRVGEPFGSSDFISGKVGVPNIMPLKAPDMYYNPGVSDGLRDRVMLFDYYVHSQVYSFNDGVLQENSTGGQDCAGNQGREAAMSLAQRIMRGETFTTVNNLVRAQRTATAAKSTTLETEFYHNCTRFSVVTISGVTGNWSVINGVHRLGAGTMNPSSYQEPGTIDGGPDPFSRSVHYYIEIDFDSSMLPADELTGFALIDGQVSVTHGPLAPDTELRPFLDLIYWYDGVIFWEPTHHFMAYPVYSPRDCYYYADTWDQLQADITNDPNGVHRGILGPMTQDPLMFETQIQGRGRFEDVSSKYVNRFIETLTAYPRLPSGDFHPLSRCRSLGVAHIEPENDPSGSTIRSAFYANLTMDAMLKHKLNHHIPLENYVRQSTRRVPYWKTTGAPTADPLGLEATASVVYPPYDGSTGDYFQTFLYKPDELPCINCNFMSRAYPLNGNCTAHTDCNVTRCADGTCESYYEFIRDTDPITWAAMIRNVQCGALEKNYTGSYNLGYCYFGDTYQSDPQQYLTATTMAPPGLGVGTNPRRRREAASAMWAPLMQYMFGTLDSDAMLYDIRSNRGGDFIIATTLSEFHGTERKRTYGNRMTSKFSVQNAPLSFDNLFDPYNLTGLPAGVLMDYGTRRMFPHINEANYPNSTNLGSPVYILSNWRAGSGGDLFPQQFGGDNSDGYLGGGTWAKLVGDPVGTLWGCAPGDGATLPMTPDSNLLRDNVTGRPMAPLYIAVDGRCAARPWPDGVTPSCRRTAFSYPKPLYSLPGKSGGAVPPEDSETMWLPDTGYLPNPRPRLVGDTRPQTPTQQSEFRDGWLEGAIGNLLSDLGAKKRQDHDAERAEYYDKVAEFRKQIAMGTDESHRERAILPLCGSDEVPVEDIPRLAPLFTTVYNPLAALEYGSEPVYFEMNGQKVTEVDIMRAFNDHFAQLREAGALCEREDGSQGFTKAILDIGLPSAGQARAA